LPLTLLGEYYTVLTLEVTKFDIDSAQAVFSSN